MYYYNRKREILKNGIIITLILLIAVFATHYIYYKFKSERNVDYSSKSLDITFHEKSGDKVELTKVTPVTDSVGLSSKSYTFTIKNNLTDTVKYKIKLVNDTKKIVIDQCGEYQIPKNIIKISIKDDNNKDEIYILSDLEKGIIKNKKIKSLDQDNYTIRVWTSTNTLPNGSNLHYHGIIKVEEER